MTLAFERRESHPMVDALLRGRVERPEELNRAIDQRDDMLDFAIALFEWDRDRALLNYFQNGLEQFQLLRHIAGSRKCDRLLDFASGYGRLTRFLVHERLTDSVTVSDIIADAMEFQAAQFGVETVVSTALPENFHAPGSYDLIFVASLFTHLPPARFMPWLRRLIELLAPDGLLIFSVHDQAIAPVKVDGIHFASHSESRVLTAEDYGSTWVTEEYIRRQAASIDRSLECLRLPRALSDWQDVYVISHAQLAHIRPRRVPKGSIYGATTLPDGIHITGWATAVEESVDRVEVRVGDQVAATTREFASSRAVAAHVGAETDSEWRMIIPHSAVQSFRYDVVTISAFTHQSQEHILHLGTIDSLIGQAARQQKWGLEQQIGWMKQSRFWKLRDAWFRITRRH